MEREIGPVALRRRPARKLARLAEEAARTTATADALALAEATGLELADTVGNTVGMNEAKVATPDPEGPGALAGCATHGMNPSRGSHTRTELRSRVATVARGSFRAPHGHRCAAQRIGAQLRPRPCGSAEAPLEAPRLPRLSPPTRAAVSCSALLGGGLCVYSPAMRAASWLQVNWSGWGLSLWSTERSWTAISVTRSS